MNQKMKATKNNILKKAYMSVAMAIFAGGLFFTTNNSFLPSNMTTTFARLGGSVFKRRFSNRSSSRNRNSSRNRYGSFSWNELSLDEKQQWTYNNFAENWDVIIGELESFMDLRGLASEVPSYKDNSNALKESAVVKVFKRIADTDEFKRLKKAARGESSRRDDEYAYAANQIITKLLDLQKALGKALVYYETVLHMKRSKNPDKIKDIEKELSDTYMNDFVKCVDFRKIIDSPKYIDEAMRLTDEALKNYFSGALFDKLSSKEKVDRWDYHMGTGSNGESVSSGISDYASTLQAILYCNSAINSIFQMITTLRVQRNFIEFIHELVAFEGRNFEEEQTRLDIMNKEKFFENISRLGHGDLIILPLVNASLSGNEQGIFSSDSLNKSNAESLMKINLDCSSKLLAALKEKNGKITGASRALRDYSESQGGNFGLLLSEGYNIKNAFANLVPDASNIDFFKSLDNERLYLFNKVLPNEAGFTQDGKTLSAYDSLMSRMNDAMQKLKNKQSVSLDEQNALRFGKSLRALEQANDPGARPQHFFMANDTSIYDTIVKVSDLGNSRDVDLLKFLLATPVTIRNRAIMRCYMSDIERFKNRKWSPETKAFLNYSNYLSDLDSVLSEYSSDVYKVYGEITEKIDKIKSKTYEKKVTQEVKAGSDETSVLSLEGGNAVRTSTTATLLPNGVVRISDPAFANLSKVNMTICPRTEGGNNSTKDHRPFADVPVTDGKVDITNDHLKDIKGTCEVHFRMTDPNTGADTFLFKLFVTPGKNDIIHKVLYNHTTEIMSGNHISNNGKIKMFGNEDGSITIELPGDNKAGNNLVGVMIEKGKDPNFEKDQFAYRYDSARDIWTATVYGVKSGATYEFHTYLGSVAAEQYQGKIVVDLSKSNRVDSEKGSTILDFVTKTGYDSHETNVKMVDRYYKFVIPRDAFDSIYDKTVTVGFWDSDKKTTYNRQDVKLSYVRESEGSGYVTYSAKVQVPKQFENCTMVIISGLDGYRGVECDRLKATSTISDKTEENAEIKFELIRNDDDNSSWYSSWY